MDSHGPQSPVVDSFNLTNIMHKVEKYFKLMQMIGEFPPKFDLGSNSGVLNGSTWNKLIEGFVKSVTEGGPYMQDPAGYVAIMAFHTDRNRDLLSCILSFNVLVLFSVPISVHRICLLPPAGQCE